MVTLAGAMSTAELGKSLAEMIRQDKVHIITCTGANLEEDVFNLVAHDHYKRIPNYRELTPQDEKDLLDGMPLKAVPRVVEDSIAVTLALGLRYLWVDRHVSTLSIFTNSGY